MKIYLKLKAKKTHFYISFDAKLVQPVPTDRSGKNILRFNLYFVRFFIDVFKLKKKNVPLKKTNSIYRRTSLVHWKKRCFESSVPIHPEIAMKMIFMIGKKIFMKILIFVCIHSQSFAYLLKVWSAQSNRLPIRKTKWMVGEVERTQSSLRNATDDVCAGCDE